MMPLDRLFSRLLMATAPPTPTLVLEPELFVPARPPAIWKSVPVAPLETDTPVTLVLIIRAEISCLARL